MGLTLCDFSRTFLSNKIIAFGSFMQSFFLQRFCDIALSAGHHFANGVEYRLFEQFVRSEWPTQDNWQVRLIPASRAVLPSSQKPPESIRGRAPSAERCEIHFFRLNANSELDEGMPAHRSIIGGYSPTT